MTAPAEVHHLDRLPSAGCVLIPSSLNEAQARALKQTLGNRPVSWVVEESLDLDNDLSSYLQSSGAPGLAFDRHEEDVPAVGRNLQGALENGGVLVYVPGFAHARPGTAVRVRPDVLRFLTELELPVVPVAVADASENALQTDHNSLPESCFAFGEVREHTTPAELRQAFHELHEELFSARPFLNESLTVHLLRGLKMHANATTVFDGTDDSELPFSKLLGAALAFSREILRYTKRDRIGIILPPGKAGLLANLAVLFANKTPVNINFTASDQAVKSAIRQADVDRFITADPFVRKLSAFPWPPNRDLVFIERELPRIKSRIMKWFLVAKILPASALVKWLKLDERSGDDEAILLFTSGSSGEPKGVPLTHRNLLANVCQFGSKLDLPADSKLLGSLPLFHSFGCTVTLWFPVIEGLDLVTFPNPLDTKRLAELIHTHGIDLFLATPTFLRGYLKRIKPEQLASLKLVITGAEKLPDTVAQAFNERFGVLPMEGYGLTETSPASNVNLPPPDDSNDGSPILPASRFTSVGQLLPGIAARITNLASDEVQSLEESGMIWLRGANVFKGYLDKPELSDQVLQDGWFRTGDVGRFDEDGFLFIEGRVSRFSKIAGEMVPHETVENNIAQMLGLEEETERKVAIVGIPDERKGEAIILLSTVAGPALEQELLDIRYRLLDMGCSALWCPKQIVPVDEIPVLASGKMDIKSCEKIVAERLGL